jgi:hypothetical protein
VAEGRVRGALDKRLASHSRSTSSPADVRCSIPMPIRGIADCHTLRALMPCPSMMKVKPRMESLARESKLANPRQFEVPHRMCPRLFSVPLYTAQSR